MHEIIPYYNWQKYYETAKDFRSPFYGKEYNYESYSETIYGYYIDPSWDFMGSETLYIKILYAQYEAGMAIIELIGEWNDAINNDIMHLKRNILEHMMGHGINKFLLIGENVFNFHGSDDCYYEEWFEEVEDGWICAINFRGFVLDEWKKYNIDMYINSGGKFDLINWRTFKPQQLIAVIDNEIGKRLGY